MGIGQCKKCKFWKPDMGMATDVSNRLDRIEVGECRFRDPVFGRWPVTKKDEWCGDWIKKPERKVKNGV